MGKNDFLTPKAIANRIKSKGLQKLRWYCQLCQKQCRDENGFKCHQMSDSHRRQMDLFGMNADRVVDGYSEEFEKSFLEHLKRAHPFSRVMAKNVYNEFIADKNHIHMNSTKWLTLTDFVKYLGREGKCKVEETEKGWWITLIQKDPMEEIAEERKLKRVAAEKEEEDRHLSEINAQIERARKIARISEADEQPEGPDALVKTDDAPVVLALAPGATATANPLLKVSRTAASKASAFAEDDEDGAGVNVQPTKGPSKLDELMKKELEAKKAREVEAAKFKAISAGNGKEVPWLQPGIVVKVMSKELDRYGYYKKKGVVEKVVDRFVGEVAMLDSGDVIRVDQAQLESVIPQPGGQVLVVRGQHKGHAAILKEIDIDKYRALIKLAEGSSKGQELWMDYEDISKLTQL